MQLDAPWGWAPAGAPTPLFVLCFGGMRMETALFQGDTHVGLKLLAV